MKKSSSGLRLAALICAGTLVPFSLVLAQSTPVATATESDPQVLAQYDTNRNGRLEEGELALWRGDQTTAATASRADETVVMSPFVVQSGDDSGYYASNTLAGTRLNSKIEDLGSAISVVTKQQLLDTAAIDINDIFLYEVNTEGSGTYTDSTPDSQNRVFDGNQENPTTANRVRGIGAANTARGNFATTSRIPVDTYNIDSVEISRGPNSSLFGLGNASGTVNINTARANLSRATSQVQLRTDDLGSLRASVDFNRPVIIDALAIRFSAVYDVRKFTRKPSYDRTHRQQLAITVRPFPSTVIRGSYESFHQSMRRPNAVTPRDAVTEWRDHGMPTWDPVTFRYRLNGVQSLPVPQSGENAVLPRGLGLDTTQYTRPSMYFEGATGELLLWTPNRLSNNTNPGAANTNFRMMTTYTDYVKFRTQRYPLFVTPGVSDKSLYDWDNVNFTSTNWQRNKADIYSLELEQRILPNLHLQLGWFLEDSDNYNVNLIRETSFLYVDINERFLDGSPNPNFLRPYVTVWEPTLQDRPEFNDNLRGALAFEHDFTKKDGWVKWLGRHQAVGYRELRMITSGSYNYREFMLDRHSWNATGGFNGSATSRVSYRYYVGDDQGFNSEYGPPKAKTNGTFDFRYPVPGTGGTGAAFNPLNATWVNEPALFGQGLNGAPRDTRREIRTDGAVLQSFFWDGRIVTTVGRRRDEQQQRTSSNQSIDPLTGHFPSTPTDIWDNWTVRSGPTKTEGIVVKPLSWLNLHYNQSDSFTPASVIKNILGEELGNPSGTGKDYGFSVNLFEGKLIARLNFYETNNINVRAQGAAATAAGRLRDLDTGGQNFNSEDWVINMLTLNNPTLAADPVALRSEMYRIIGLPDGWFESFSGFAFGEVADVLGKGVEIELNYRPSANWDIRMTGARQETIDANISDASREWIEMRMPAWTSINDPVAGVNWWTDSGAEDWFNGQFGAAYKLGRANIGKPRTQVREWRLNTITSYRFTEGRLRGARLGGSIRWESKASIGYLGADPVMTPDGLQIIELDDTHPFFDPARTYVDFFGSYQFRLRDDKVKMTVQLNVRNAFEGGRLQGTAVNPDGNIHTFRIVDPRQIMLTTTFDF